MAYSPLTIEEIICEWNVQNELLAGGDFEGLEPEPDAGVAAQWWSPGWIPFASNGGGDLFCVDTAPADGGTRGQVISHSHESGKRKKLAASLGEYLKQIADDLDDGAVYHDTDWGLVAGPPEE